MLKRVPDSEVDFRCWWGVWLTVLTTFTEPTGLNVTSDPSATLCGAFRVQASSEPACVVPWPGPCG